MHATHSGVTTATAGPENDRPVEFPGLSGPLSFRMNPWCQVVPAEGAPADKTRYPSCSAFRSQLSARPSRKVTAKATPAVVVVPLAEYEAEGQAAARGVRATKKSLVVVLRRVMLGNGHAQELRIRQGPHLLMPLQGTETVHVERGGHAGKERRGRQRGLRAPVTASLIVARSENGRQQGVISPTPLPSESSAPILGWPLARWLCP